MIKRSSCDKRTQLLSIYQVTIIKLHTCIGAEYRLYNQMSDVIISIYLPIYLSIYLSIYLCIYLSIYLSSIYLSYLSIYLFVIHIHYWTLTGVEHCLHNRVGDVIVAVLDDMSLKPITTLIHHANLHKTANRRRTQSMREIEMTYTVIQMMMLMIVMTLLVMIVPNSVIAIMIMLSVSSQSIIYLTMQVEILMLHNLSNALDAD